MPGTRLAKKVLELAPTGDVTVVATARSPGVLVFDNAGVDSLPPAAEGSLLVRHAADLGAVVMHLDSSDGVPLPVTPAADPEFAKSDQFKGYFVDDILQVWATRQLTPSDLIAGLVLHVVAGNRYELLLVGTKTLNARFVVLRKALAP